MVHFLLLCPSDALSSFITDGLHFWFIWFAVLWHGELLIIILFYLILGAYRGCFMPHGMMTSWDCLTSWCHHDHTTPSLTCALHRRSENPSPAACKGCGHGDLMGPLAPRGHMCSWHEYPRALQTICHSLILCERLIKLFLSQHGWFLLVREI